jgi:hypothetical protein
MALNIQTLRKWIRTTLGEPVVCVEMTDEQIDVAVEEAMEWWSAYRGWYLQHSFSVVEGQAEYDLSSVDPAVIDVMKVWFTIDPRLDLSGTWPGFLDINGYPYDGFDHEQSQGGFYSGIVQWLQMREIGARVLSADLDWFFNDKTKTLTVTPSNASAGTAILLYSTPFKKSYLSQVPPDQAHLIREYSLAWSKYILGRIRGKYTGGLPAAQGNVSLDGADLIREAQEDFQRLEQKMLDLMPPPGIVIG